MRILFILFLITSIKSQESNQWTFGTAFTFSHFQQQVKSTIGDPKGERLVNINELGIDLNLYYQLKNNYSIGLFIRSDFGGRSLANFDGFDADGKTKVKDKIGGDFQEYWFGPIFKGQWNHFFIELAYAPIAWRVDDARIDLPSVSGNKTTAFSTHPTIAYMLGLGASFNVTKRFDAQFKVEYRVRYYEKREDEDIAGNVNIGSQSIVPVIGLIWKL